MIINNILLNEQILALCDSSSIFNKTHNFPETILSLINDSFYVLETIRRNKIVKRF